MGRAWCEASEAARQTFAEADETLLESLGAPLSTLCFDGPADRLNRTDIAQPAIYACSVACYRGLVEREDALPLAAAAGLSLGEYTALHLAGVFDFLAGLQLVALRGRLMQAAAETCSSGMVALIGADETTAREICDEAARGDVLVCANFNAPGQIVLSGHLRACEGAVAAAAGRGLQAKLLAVAGAFHSPLMQPAADGMAGALGGVDLRPPSVPVWSNVTASPHDPQDMELLRHRLVEQIVRPVQWSETCRRLAGGDTMEYHELAPGAVLRGLARRIDRKIKVTNHDQPRHQS
jgi:[acyl-carrier-protein] S-malonyltransferase